MESARQKAFQKLRPACVELSAVALKFRGNQTSVKSVLQALDAVHVILAALGRDNALDEKLAEYAFFPFSHIFNESQRLSARCLELALRCVEILVSQGWRQKLSPEMGKQLLILCSLLAGGSPGSSRNEPPGADLKMAAFDCMKTLITWLGRSSSSQAMFDDITSKSIVDQMVYILLEAIAESPDDQVQIAAATALQVLTDSISSRVVLASLLPRTVSALTKALKPSTRARRSYRVLEENLLLLTKTLRFVLNDASALSGLGQVVEDQSPTGTKIERPEEQPILDQAWLKATASQVRIALASVVKLRLHDKAEVRQALLQLCLVVIEECTQSLAECLHLMIETVVVLAQDSTSNNALVTLRHFATANPSVLETLESSLHSWIMSLPRVMLASDDRPKELLLTKISVTHQVLAETGRNMQQLDDMLASVLIDSISAATLDSSQNDRPKIIESPAISLKLTGSRESSIFQTFQPLLLHHRSQKNSLAAVEKLLLRLKETDMSNRLKRAVIDKIADGEPAIQIAATWLSLKLLGVNEDSDVIMDDFLQISASDGGLENTIPYLTSDLYSYTMPFLLDDSNNLEGSPIDWRLSALSIECLVLQASQLGVSYRPELIETLYPVLSLCGSPNAAVKSHAMVALDKVAVACQYSSTSKMLVDNVDYLVNSIAIKLNSFDLSPQAPQVLLLMIRMCGARLVPYLDDLIGSIFAALDSFHGYPQLVELLFDVLTAVIDEGAKSPALAITDGRTAPQHRKNTRPQSTVDTILEDLTARKTKTVMTDAEHEDRAKQAPRRPWSSKLDRPQERSEDIEMSEQDDLGEGDAEELPMSQDAAETEAPLSKTHTLLLNIAQATTPHLSSPSPRVRRTLLQLITRIAPFLSRDENSFLPLINAVWPAVTSRLFGEVGDDGEGEAGYNVCAAADTMSRLCEGAGDFMASRIDDTFPRLEKLFKKSWAKSGSHRVKASQKSFSDAVGSCLTGTVDLRLVGSKSTTRLQSAGGLEIAKPQAHDTAVLRTTDTQILNALVDLLVTIVNHVRVSEDIGDSILDMLAPMLDDAGRDAVRAALENWNADAVWLTMERKHIEKEIQAGTRSEGDWAWRGLGSEAALSSGWSSHFSEIVF